MQKAQGISWYKQNRKIKANLNEKQALGLKPKAFRFMPF
jgi:hypothetical protein